MYTPGTGAIEGRATTTGGSPLANICAAISKGPWYEEARTNANGAYTLSGLPPGRYAIAFSPCGRDNYFYRAQFYKARQDPGPPALSPTPDLVSVKARAVTTGVDASLVSLATSDGGPQWLQVINEYRRASGLRPVYDEPLWDAALAAHLRYLRLTPAKYFTGPYRSLHTENPASPYYSSQGAQAADSSDLYPGISSPMAAIDGWLEAPFHAIGMLRPGLQRVAFGYQSGEAGLDVISGLGATVATSPVVFPGNGMTTGLTSFGGELPNPLQTCGWTSAGLPMIVLLPYPPGPVSATLVSSAGTVESSAKGTLCIVDQSDYRSSDPVYGSTGAAILAADHAVLLFPKAQLVRGTYTVRMVPKPHAPVVWSFHVRPGAA